MDIKAYIQSGAIEAYVLGLAPAEECAELEALRMQYPEVNAAVIAFEKELERAAIAGAEAPPANVKAELNKRLAGEFNTGGNGKVAEMSRTPVGVRPFWKYLAAACMLLFVASSVLNLYFHNLYKATDKRYTELLAQQNTLMANNNVMNTKLNAMDETLRIMSDPAIKPVSMPSAKAGQEFRATVYWDTKTKDVYVLNNSLPTPPQGKQYQLWALVGGKPVDAGTMDACTGLCHMKVIPEAEAFAVTLERQGGSPTPDLSQLYVLGKI